MMDCNRDVRISVAVASARSTPAAAAAIRQPPVPVAPDPLACGAQVSRTPTEIGLWSASAHPNQTIFSWSCSKAMQVKRGSGLKRG